MAGEPPRGFGGMALMASGNDNPAPKLESHGPSITDEDSGTQDKPDTAKTK